MFNFVLCSAKFAPTTNDAFDWGHCCGCCRSTACQWQVATALIVRVKSHNAEQNQTLLIAIAGYTNYGQDDSVEIYSVSTDSTLDGGATMPGPREGFGSILLNNTIHIFGGYDGFNMLDNFWSYDTALDQWKTDVLDVPTATVASAATFSCWEEKAVLAI